MIKEIDHLRKMQASIAKKRLSLDKLNMTDEDREQMRQLSAREQSISEYIDEILNRWNDR